MSKKKPTKPSHIILTLVLVLVTAIVLIVSNWERSIEISQDSFRIPGMYGTEVSFSDVAAITLVEESMSEIGAGSRRNGTSIPGLILRGHFSSGLLFTSPESAPTIRIERIGTADIFLSFSDASLTRETYVGLTDAFMAKNH